MKTRGFTLIEILVAVVLFVVVASMGVYVFTAQNRGWKMESDKVAVQMMAKGTLDELSRAARLTGNGLPEGMGGIEVFGGGPERATFVSNEDGAADTVRGFEWTPGAGRLSLAVTDSRRFSELGYVWVELNVPLVAGPGVSATAATTVRPFVLPVVDRTTSAGGGCGDSIILDVTSLEGTPNFWNSPGNIRPVTLGLVQKLDSTTYRQSGDTLYLRRNRLGESVFAIGVDTLRLSYFHPADGWRDSLSGSVPANVVSKVRIRLVMRSPKPDFKLLEDSPATRGYRFSRLEMEVALRATALTNR